MDFAYCLIKHKCNGVAVDVKDGDDSPGAQVIVWSHHGDDNQIWYSDPTTGTIRSKMNNYCLDLEGERVVLNPFKMGDENQQWKFHGNVIRSILDHDKVLQIKGCAEPGAELGSGKFDDKDNQLWDFELVGGHADHMRPPLFYIVSEMNNKVVDIERGTDEENAKVIMWAKGPEKQLNQLWYIDGNGHIRSALNNMVFHSKQSGRKLRTSEYKHSNRHQWKIDENKIINGDGECLDIRGASEENGANMCSYHPHGKNNQLWRMEYV